MEREDGNSQDDLFRKRSRTRDNGPDEASDLRYEGPVRGRRREPTRRPGTPFLAAALLAGAVVVLVGVTLILRDDEAPGAETAAVAPPPPLEALRGQADSPTDVADSRLLPPPGRSPASALTGEPAPADASAAGDQDASDRTPTAPAQADADGPASATAAPPAREPAARVPAPAAPTPAPSTSAVTASIGELVRAGDIDGAFRAGKSLAREAAGRGDYTVQVLSVRSLASVREAFAKVRDDRLVVVSLDSGQGTLYRLLWGFYPTREEAQRAAASCPRYFPRSTGWPFTPPVAAALKPPAR